jgi:hypothetical protein
LKLGYTNLSGADFEIENKAHIAAWKPGIITLHEIESDIPVLVCRDPPFFHLSPVVIRIIHWPEPLARSLLRSSDSRLFYFSWQFTLVLLHLN